jgi:hypothetical protein
MGSFSPGESGFWSVDSGIAISLLMLRSRRSLPPWQFSLVVHCSSSSVVVFVVSIFFFIVASLLANTARKSPQLDTYNVSSRSSIPCTRLSRCTSPCACVRGSSVGTWGGGGGGNAIGYWSQEARKSKYPGVSRQSRREINK